MLSHTTAADLLVAVGFIAYLFFYLVALAFFLLRARQGDTLLSIKDITLSVVLAMVGSTIVFLTISAAFVG